MKHERAEWREMTSGEPGQGGAHGMPLHHQLWYPMRIGVVPRRCGAAVADPQALDGLGTILCEEHAEEVACGTRLTGAEEQELGKRSVSATETGANDGTRDSHTERGWRGRGEVGAAMLATAEKLRLS